MKEDTNNILNDDRNISMVAFSYEGDAGGVYRSSEEIKIEAYPEPGEHCYIPWIRVLKNGEVISRFPAGMVSIYYEATK